MWCDDERDTTDTIKYYSDGWTKDQDAGLTLFFKDLAKTEMNYCNSIQWHEIEYKDYSYEVPLYTATHHVQDIDHNLLDTNITQITCTDQDQSNQDTETSESAKVDDNTNVEPPPLTEQDDLTYQGLVKNNFMYA